MPNSTLHSTSDITVALVADAATAAAILASSPASGCCIAAWAASAAVAIGPQGLENIGSRFGQRIGGCTAKVVAAVA